MFSGWNSTAHIVGSSLSSNVDECNNSFTWVSCVGLPSPGCAGTLPTARASTVTEKRERKLFSASSLSGAVLNAMHTGNISSVSWSVGVRTGSRWMGSFVTKEYELSLLDERHY
jgi:hypothetical protein